MSRIFSISGNFMQRGKWAEPDPSFSGKIVVDENDEFYGFCEELYASTMSDINRIRYLAGAFANNGRDGKRGIAFYKMSNEPMQAPLLYVMPNLEVPKTGLWAKLHLLMGYFITQYDADITVKEEAFSAEEEANIKAKYDALDKSINGHGELLKQIQHCKDSIIDAE